jgi:hypothetical protein
MTSGNKAQLHPVGGRHHDQHADEDCRDRLSGRIKERGLEIAAAEDDAIGLEAVDAAPHAQGEFERCDERREEIERADHRRDPGREPAAAHLTHRLARARR